MGTEFRHESLDSKVCVRILYQNHRFINVMENDLKHRVWVCNVTLLLEKAVGVLQCETGSTWSHEHVCMY